MTVQMLFYQEARPVSVRRHAGCSVEVRDYGFCRGVNSVPLAATEFRSVAAEYPIVFAVRQEGVQPLAVLGLRSGENLFISEAGEWQGRYIPAFVRRYPFVFSTDPRDEHRFALCVDEAYEGFNREGRGEALFTPDGKPSLYVDKVLRFLQDYRAQFLRTRAFCARLAELDLLQPMQALLVQGDRRLSLGGFSAVDRGKLKALRGDQLAELVGSDALELVYLHLQSLRNFETLRARMPPPAEESGLAASPLASLAGGGRVTVH